MVVVHVTGLIYIKATTVSEWTKSVTLEQHITKRQVVKVLLSLNSFQGWNPTLHSQQSVVRFTEGKICLGQCLGVQSLRPSNSRSISNTLSHSLEIEGNFSSDISESGVLLPLRSLYVSRGDRRQPFCK